MPNYIGAHYVGDEEIVGQLADDVEGYGEFSNVGQAEEIVGAYMEAGYDPVEAAILGAQYMAGQDNEVGARRRRFRAPARPTRRPPLPPMRRPVTVNPSVVRSEPKRQYRLMMPLGTLSIAAAGTQTFQAVAQATFRPERITIAPDVPAAIDLLRVTQITVGKDNIFVSTGAATAKRFQHDAVVPSLRGYTLTKGTTFAIQVANADAVNARVTTVDVDGEEVE